MSDVAESPSAPPGRRLSDAIREVKNAVADRADVVVELREAQRTRLELLANELAPVFQEVPEDVDFFDFVISSGTQPRLWIDAVSHVTMGRDRRTFRFLRDTRMGRVVLAESGEIKPVADQVTRHIAERMVERQQLIEGDIEPVIVGGGGAAGGNPSRSPQYAEPVRDPAEKAATYETRGDEDMTDTDTSRAEPALREEAAPSGEAGVTEAVERRGPGLAALGWVLLGAVFGTIGVLLLMWDDLPEIGQRLFG